MIPSGSFSRPIAWSAAILITLLSSAPARAIQSGDLFTNVRGRALNFPTHQTTPLALSADGARLFVVNQPGARLEVFDAASRVRLLSIPVGIGGVALAERPAANEVWVVDEIQSTVFVVDLDMLTVSHSIRVGGSPRGIVFSPSYDRAFVSCGGVDRVDVIDVANYSVAASVAIPAKQPTGIAWLGGKVWVAPLLSGNDTAPIGETPQNTNAAVDVERLGDYPGVVSLPDRDLFAIDPGPTPADAALTGTPVRGLGTVLFNLHVRPGTSELWIPCTEALNADHRGERSFIDGQIVSNRVTVVDTTTGQVRIHDLDALSPGPGSRCAQPTGIAFNADGSRAFVCGYNSDIVAVLDIAPDGSVAWAGSIKVLPGQSYPEGAGARTAVVTADGAGLFVFSKVDEGIATVDLSALPASGFHVPSDPPLSLGYSPVAVEEIRGRFLFIDAHNSRSGTSSCASCHVEALTDGIAWELSAFLDPQNKPEDQLEFGVDVKGPMVTQSTARLAETAPYHWRGEKHQLKQFDGAFVGLLENETTLGGNFIYIERYLKHLALAPNPRQRLDRVFTVAERRGATVFQTVPSFGGFTCADCHQLPLGTSGEIVPFKAGGFAKSGVVPPLRGVGDKLSPIHNAGGSFGTRTELGAGLLHHGSVASIHDLLTLEDPGQPGQPLFTFTAAQIADLEAFLLAFDTGLAPAAAYAYTARGENPVEDQAQFDFLINQAERGNCDLVFHAPPPPGRPERTAAGLYRPEIGAFERNAAQLGPLSPAQLLAAAGPHRPITLLGLPRLSGETFALDLDRDGLYDLDELRLGTDREDPDTDGDSFPDGYEVEQGSNPLVPNGSVADNTPPALQGSVEIDYTTQTAIVFVFRTTERARVTVYVDGRPDQRVPLGPWYDDEFFVVLGELTAGTTYSVDLELMDPAGNTATSSLSLSTRPPVFPAPVHVRAIQGGVAPGTGSTPDRLVFDVALVAGSAFPVPGYTVSGPLYYRRASDGELRTIAAQLSSVLTGTTGRVPFSIDLPDQALLGGLGELIFVVESIDAPAGQPPYAEGLDEAGPATFTW